MTGPRRSEGAATCDGERGELGVPSLEAMTSYTLAETLDDPSAAGSAYREALELAARSGADFVSGLASTSLAALELRVGHHQRARKRLRTVIAHWERGGIRNQQWLAIRILIDALAATNEYEPIAVLVGAYEASQLAGPAYGDDAVRLADTVERARRHLGTDRYEAEYRRGATLTDAQAASLAHALTAPSPDPP